MKIIALSGKKGSGKSFIANRLEQRFIEDGKVVKRLSFAYPLKQIVGDMLGLTYDQVNSFKNKQQHKFPWKGKEETVRTILQEMGDILRKQRENIFVDFMNEILYVEAKDGVFDCIIIDDLRFNNEHQFLTELDAFIVAIIDDNCDNKDMHKSENELTDHSFNMLIDNTDKDIFQAETFINEIRNTI